jgi:hypothetical protein
MKQEITYRITYSDGSSEIISDRKEASRVKPVVRIDLIVKGSEDVEDLPDSPEHEGA